MTELLTTAEEQLKAKRKEYKYLIRVAREHDREAGRLRHQAQKVRREIESLDGKVRLEKRRVHLESTLRGDRESET